MQEMAEDGRSIEFFLLSLDRYSHTGFQIESNCYVHRDMGIKASLGLACWHVSMAGGHVPMEASWRSISELLLYKTPHRMVHPQEAAIIMWNILSLLLSAFRLTWMHNSSNKLSVPIKSRFQLSSPKSTFDIQASLSKTVRSGILFMSLYLLAYGHLEICHSLQLNYS